MRISDWSSDVCSSDLHLGVTGRNLRSAVRRSGEQMPSSSARVIARTVALVVAVVLASAAPASADPAGPSDFPSEVMGMRPATAAADAEIPAGASFPLLPYSAGIEEKVNGSSDSPYPRSRTHRPGHTHLAT